MTQTQKLEEMTMVLINGNVKKVLDVFDRADFFTSDDGKYLVKHAGLLRAFKKQFVLSHYNVRVEQAPQLNNDWCACVCVDYMFSDKVAEEDHFDRGYNWSASADCRSGTSEMDKYTTAVAETRASARALRSILGIEMCSLEEVAGPFNKGAKRQEAFVPEQVKAGLAEQTQLMLIERKFFKEIGKSMADIEKIVKRKVEGLIDLTKEEAALVIEKFNK